jgi:hypothetical protein
MKHDKLKRWCCRIMVCSGAITFTVCCARLGEVDAAAGSVSQCRRTAPRLTRANCNANRRRATRRGTRHADTGWVT